MRPAARRGVKKLGGSGLTAADVMVRDVVTVGPETPIDEVVEIFQLSNINGAPVVDAGGHLIGIITEDDLVFGQMGLSEEELASLRPSRGEPQERFAAGPRRVGEIMTSSPISAEEETPVEELCRLMWGLKIHRVPIVNKGKVTGIVSTLDICRLVAEGRVRLSPAAGR